MKTILEKLNKMIKKGKKFGKINKNEKKIWNCLKTFPDFFHFY